MQATEYKLKHQYQPTNTSCSPTALSMLLSHYGKTMSVDEVSEQVPQVQDEHGQNFGTINTQMAVWCLSLGFKVSVYTFDCQVIDQSWAKLSKDRLLARLKLRKSGWAVPALGELWTKGYVQSYIDFLNDSGDLHIQPSVSSKLLYDLLKKGPILPCLSYSTLYGESRQLVEGEEDTVDDDINGRALNHSVVIYGNDSNGNFLVADPFNKPGRHVVEPERMIAAISTAQIECDNLLFVIQE